jgi:polysaccharide export outer membrane protein
MYKLKLLITLVSCGAVLSCTSKKEILYLQDVDSLENAAIPYTNAKIQPNDALRIEVGALEPESVVPYNRPVANGGGGMNVAMLQLQGYLVTEDLTINFPILGTLSVANKTTQEFAEDLRVRLETGGHLKSPTVDVRLLNAKVTILGEVNAPGTITFTEQNISLPQALGLAGDLTINGKREDILIMREEGGVRQIAHIDLTQSDWLSGPFSFVKPNDVIVVNPNNPKVKSAGFVGNVGTLISVVSILFSTIVLISR